MAEKIQEAGGYIGGYLKEVEDKMEGEGDRFQVPEGAGHYPVPEGYWRTALSQAAPHKIFIRGYPLVDLIGNCSFTEVLYLELFGELPDERHEEMFDALLTCITDHQMTGAQPPLVRYCVSGNPQFTSALAAGILSIGSNTVSPYDSARLINRACDLMKKENLSYDEMAKRIVAEYRQEHRRMPGFGHPIHSKYDPRAVRLFQVAQKLGFLGEKTEVYIAIYREFVKTYGKGRDIPINIDGAMACVCTDMGWDPVYTLAAATISLIIGMSAHIIEELQNPVYIRWVHDCDYIGVPPRPLPKEKIKL